jgi:hypothetical protein
MHKKINRKLQKEKRLEDLASERAVLAALCQYGLDVYLDIDFINAGSFTDPMNQLIFECIYKSIFYFIFRK